MHDVGKRVAILQSNYIPWRGYFDIIGLVDEFVIYDVAQFTKNDWRNRNLIKTAQGVRWLTIPVATAGKFGQTIGETQIAAKTWAEKHWRSVAQAYAKAPFFARYRDRLESAYVTCGTLRSLSAVNRLLIDLVAAELGLSARIIDANAYPVSEGRNQRLLSVCRTSGATVYVSGPSARSYLDLTLFAEAGIRVKFMDYSSYAPYPQLHGPFEPGVSVLDLLFNTGPAALSHMQCGQRSGPL